MTRLSHFPKCRCCGNRFDRSDPRGCVNGGRDICPLCRALNHGRPRWVIKNNCNGPFAEFDTRIKANHVCDRDYPGLGCYVVPGVLVTEAVDARRAVGMGFEENEREELRLRGAA